jgi:hypothetical protein
MLFTTNIKKKDIINYLRVANDIIHHTQIIDKNHIELVYKAIIYMSDYAIMMTKKEN